LTPRQAHHVVGHHEIVGWGIFIGFVGALIGTMMLRDVGMQAALIMPL
jgi:hypothetical protein